MGWERWQVALTLKDKHISRSAGTSSAEGQGTSLKSNKCRQHLWRHGCHTKKTTCKWLVRKKTSGKVLFQEYSTVTDNISPWIHFAQAQIITQSRHICVIKVSLSNKLRPERDDIRNKCKIKILANVLSVTAFVHNKFWVRISWFPAQAPQGIHYDTEGTHYDNEIDDDNAKEGANVSWACLGSFQNVTYYVTHMPMVSIYKKTSGTQHGEAYR